MAKGKQMTKENNGFDKWYFIGDKCDVREWKSDNTNQYYKIKEAWNHQQEKIDKLEKEKKRALDQLYLEQNVIHKMSVDKRKLGADNKKLKDKVSELESGLDKSYRKYRSGQFSALKEKVEKLTACAKLYGYSIHDECLQHDEYDIFYISNDTGKLARKTLSDIRGNK